MVKKSHPVDIHVGKNLKRRRIEIGMSQQAIGEVLGISFQQIQKYESGANRVSASRLYDICKHLDVGVPYFFEGAENVVIDDGSNTKKTEENIIMTGRESLELLRSYAKIKDSNIRQNVRSLLASLAQSTSN